MEQIENPAVQPETNPGKRRKAAAVEATAVAVAELSEPVSVETVKFGETTFTVETR